MTQSFGPQCYQIDPVYPSDATVSEDCLFLNIYKPSAIVVTINYRLNFLGFSAGAEIAANNGLNLGLLDQRLALEWVQANIKAFGGDVAGVTIFG